MNEHKLKKIWSEDNAVINGWLTIPNSWSAEVMAQAGWDSLVIDFQHGYHTIETALQIFQVMDTTGTFPMARAPWNDPIYIQRLLDAGALGIICPMVNTREECEKFVGAMRYFPVGYRSAGPTRPRLTMGGDYVKWANDAVIAMAMIETAEAVGNLDAILSVEGLDAIYVGPGDLGMTLGVKGADTEDPKQLAIYDEILAGCKKYGLFAGLHCGSADYAQRMIDKGFRFVTINSDSGHLLNSAQAAVNQIRQTNNQKATY